MKTNKNLCYLLLLFFITASCKKSADQKLTDDNLTTCEKNATCSYLFIESADINENLSLIPGNYRLFMAHTDYKPDINSEKTFVFKAPMQGNSFELDAEAIKDGKVSYRFICPACNAINYKPVGGKVTGINTTPNKPADQAKWLIEAEIVLEAEANQPGTAGAREVINIKQYFAPTFVYN